MRKFFSGIIQLFQSIEGFAQEFLLKTESLYSGMKTLETETNLAHVNLNNTLLKLSRLSNTKYTENVEI